MGEFSWYDDGMVKKYLNWVSKDLGVFQMEDWYQVTRNQIVNLNGSGLFSRFHSLDKALQYIYPSKIKYR
jgi:hypothetical protein